MMDEQELQLRIDKIIVKYGDEIQKKYEISGLSYYLCVMDIIHRERNDASDFYKKFFKNEEVKKYMFEALRLKKVELKDIDVLNIF